MSMMVGRDQGTESVVLAMVIITAFMIQHGGSERTVSPRRTMIFGPALDPNIVLPVRYFYIQLVDTNGNNFTDSIGEDPFEFQITLSDGGRVRAWKQILDRHDGSYIGRFRLYETYKGVVMELKYKGQHIADSPYKFEGPAYQETCNCPEPNDSIWAKTMKCPAEYRQIERDLAQFPTVNLKRLRKEAVERFGTGNHALCHYSIIDGKLYRKTYGQHVGFTMFSDAFLLSLLRKVKIPNVEFFLNLGDWPLDFKKHDPIPIFSWCGSEETSDIVMPTYDITESTLEGLSRVTLDMMTIQANTGPKWKDKIEKALWRGRDSRQERLDLVVMGRKKTDLYDVALTNFFFFPYDEKKYGPKGQHISFFDFFKYKYQLNIDGTVAAYRFPYLLGGDAVVFKQDSNYYEHFYKDLTPWTHYIPFKRDLSDLEEKLLWAKSHDKEAQEIGLNGQRYARDNLMSDKIFCYYWHLFKDHCILHVSFEMSSKHSAASTGSSMFVNHISVWGGLNLSYAWRLEQKPKVHKGMDYIKQPDDRDSQCHCEKESAYKATDKDRKSGVRFFNDLLTEHRRQQLTN